MKYKKYNIISVLLVWKKGEVEYNEKGSKRYHSSIRDFKNMQS
jgi:hypothetical protein